MKTPQVPALPGMTPLGLKPQGTALEAWATLAWMQMDDNAKAGVRIGLFPARCLDAAKLYNWTPRDVACALMDEAKKDGGMIA